MCALVQELRRKEKMLARRVVETKLLEDSIYKASQDLIDALRAKRSQLQDLEGQAETVQTELRRAVEGVAEDEDIRWYNKKLDYLVSEDTESMDIAWHLGQLGKEAKAVRQTIRERREDKGDESAGWAWWRWWW